MRHFRSDFQRNMP